MKSTLLIGIISLLLIGCSNDSDESCASTAALSFEELRTIELYTLGNVPDSLCNIILDSLKAHYPKCVFIKSIPLPESALTYKHRDHARFRADALNKYLKKYKGPNNIVIGFTKQDIGLDDFRDCPHYGIRGLANGIGNGVAVFSDYRGGKSELSRLMQHELAHAFGVKHCCNPGCIMQDQDGENKLKSSPRFCDTCAKRLRQQAWNL